MTTNPRTESPRCSNLQPDVNPGRNQRSGQRELSRTNDTYISLSELGSSGGCTGLSEKARGPCGSIYITFVPTWMVFEKARLPCEETAMGEYLRPDTAIFDIRQWRQVFLRNVWSTPATKYSATWRLPIGKLRAKRTGERSSR